VKFAAPPLACAMQLDIYKRLEHEGVNSNKSECRVQNGEHPNARIQKVQDRRKNNIEIGISDISMKISRCGHKTETGI
jgi:hypothetical protein